MNNAVVWESCGYFFFISLKSHHYVLYKDSISVQSGVGTQITHSIKLHNIVAKEMVTSPLSRLFNTGKIRLITRGNDIPDLTLYVKSPDIVMDLIEETKQEDHRQFLESYNNRNNRYDGKNNNGNYGKNKNFTHRQNNKKKKEGDYAPHDGS